MIAAEKKPQDHHQILHVDHHDSNNASGEDSSINSQVNVRNFESTPSRTKSSNRLENPTEDNHEATTRGPALTIVGQANYTQEHSSHHGSTGTRDSRLIPRTGDDFSLNYDTLVSRERSAAAEATVAGADMSPSASATDPGFESRKQLHSDEAPPDSGVGNESLEILEDESNRPESGNTEDSIPAPEPPTEAGEDSGAPESVDRLDTEFESRDSGATADPVPLSKVKSTSAYTTRISQSDLPSVSPGTSSMDLTSLLPQRRARAPSFSLAPVITPSASATASPAPLRAMFEKSKFDSHYAKAVDKADKTEKTEKVAKAEPSDPDIFDGSNGPHSETSSLKSEDSSPNIPMPRKHSASFSSLTMPHGSSPPSVVSYHSKGTSESSSTGTTKFFRPAPSRQKSSSGFSTVTPSRPTMNTLMAKGRRPSSAPNPHGLNGAAFRSKSESSATSNGANTSPDMNSFNVRRRPSVASSIASVDSPVSTTPAHGDGVEDESYFVLARLEEEKDAEQHAPGEGKLDEGKKGWFSPASYLQASFQAVKDSVLGGEAQAKAAATSNGGTPADDTNAAAPVAEETDWEFWGKVMNDYETTVRKHPRTFTRKLHQGIPDTLRGMVWQLICNGKDPELENHYANLITRTSIHEKVIQRDLARTFPKHERFQEPGGPGQESLFNIIKAYSLYDTEIGYCQGIAFVVGALLLNMPDEEAFCVLVRLMKDYRLRDLYTPQMLGLQLRLYQYDELLEEQFPAVAKHLEAQEVKSTMYTSQWFMTMFAYRFPLSAVFRIMDVIFAEGADAMLRFALALIKRNQEHILTLDFEPLLEFLKNGLFDVYADNVGNLISDAASIRMTKSRLDKLAAEHAEAIRMTSPEHMEAEALRIEMRRMVETVRRMELEYEILNREHVTLANKLLDATVAAERDRELAKTLKARCDDLEARAADERRRAEENSQADIDRLAHKNFELTAKNAELQEEVDKLETTVADTKLKWVDCENERSELQRKWDGLRKVLG